MIQAIVFDLDDTLISEREFIRSGMSAVAVDMASRTSVPIDAVLRALLEATETHPGRVFNTALDAIGIDADSADISHYVEVYRRHNPSISFYPDVVPTLSALRGEGLRLGILTDGYAAVQRRKLSAVGAEVLFDRIVVTDELGRDYWKPDTRAFHILAQDLGIGVHSIAYVGDNPRKDFAIAEAGITTVRIRREGGVYINSPYLNGIREHHTVECLYQLPQALGFSIHHDRV